MTNEPKKDATNAQNGGAGDVLENVPAGRKAVKKDDDVQKNDEMKPETSEDHESMSWDDAGMVLSGKNRAVVPKEEKKNGSSLSRPESKNPSQKTEEEVKLEGRCSQIRRFAGMLKKKKNLVAEVQTYLKTMTKCTEQQRKGTGKPIEDFLEKLEEMWSKLETESWLEPILDVLHQASIESADELVRLFRAAAEEKKWADELKTESEKLRKEIGRLEAMVLKERKEKESWKSSYQQLKGEMEEMKGEKMNLEKKRNDDASERGTVISPEIKFWVREKRLARTGNVSVSNFGGSEQENEWEKKEAQAKEMAELWRQKERGKAGRAEQKELVEQDGSVRSVAASKKSTAQGLVDGIARMMRASALPEPKVFDGLGSVAEFKRTFYMKFQPVTQDERDLKAILEDKYLKDMAKVVWQALPGRRVRPMEELFKEFEKKLAKRRGDEEMTAQYEWEKLRKKEDMMLWEYCLEIEKWSRKANPDASEAELSPGRTVKLLNEVNDASLYNLLMIKGMEVSRGERYEVVKDVVVQYESQAVGQPAGKKRFGWKGRKVEDRRKNWDETVERREESAEERTDRRSETGVMQSKVEGIRATDEQSEMEERKCFRCGGRGHVQWQCASREVNAVEVVRCEKSWAGRVGNAGKEVAEECTILGQKNKCIIDSGSVVSVISTATWERLKSGCKDWKNKCDVFGRPNFLMRDAQRAVIPLVGQVRMQIEVKGRRTVIVCQLMKNEKEICLLGTNAFKGLGVELRWRSPRGKTRGMEDRTIKRDQPEGKYKESSDVKSHEFN